MNPAFGPNQVRELTEIFTTKGNEVRLLDNTSLSGTEWSTQLRDMWLIEIQKSRRDRTELDVFSWLNRATLDIIGLAGE